MAALIGGPDEQFADRNSPIPSPPRVVAISGVIFSVALYHQPGARPTGSPCRPKGPRYLACRSSLSELGQYRTELGSFTGIAFLWFMAVLRNRIGLLEDRFFATVFLGSGLLFIAMLFAAVAVSRDCWKPSPTTGHRSASSETYAVGRATAYAS